MASDTFDYVIVGAGTAGLVVANRISENPNVTLAVIEAGGNADADPRVAIPGLFSAAVGSDLDWGFGGVPQTALNGRRIGLAQGKLLGGSSSINAQALNPFSTSDINSWEGLGNSGWNWASLSQYLAKALSIALPDEETVEHLNIGWAKQLIGKYNGPVDASFVDSLGYPLIANPFEGQSTGAYTAASTINANNTRSSSSSAYYRPLLERPNVKVFLNSTVEKIVLDTAHVEPRAVGVNILHEGTRSIIHAKKKVILSAGVFNTPKLLELSGIGDPSILTELGIDVQVANSHVGRNLQDHILCAISFECQDGIPTVDDLARQDPVALQSAMEMYQKHQSGPFASSGITSFGYLPTPDFRQDPGALEKVLQALKKGTPGESPIDAARRSHVRNILETGEGGSGQYFLFMSQTAPSGGDTTGKFDVKPQPGNYISITTALSHPLSTGTSHICSADVDEPPTIDHQYFLHPLDLELLSRHVRYLETIAATEPFASLLKPNGRRKDPLSFVGEDLEKAKAYARNMSTTNWHSCGTCAMAPRDKGGVVDERLRVHGVSGLRIVDASVFPFIPQSNLQSLVYAVAEKASDIIKEEC